MTSVKTYRRTATTALLSLALGGFGIGVTEFVTMGLLPNIAQDLLPEQWAQDPETAIAHAGLLVSTYALGVVIGAPTVAIALARFPRHRVMVVLAAALLIFNGLTVVAPTFELVALSRFLAGLPHGAYFGIASLVAAQVMGPGRRAQGVAYVMTGLTVATIIGVPLGTLLGQHLGWRAAYLVVVAIFALTAVSILSYVPAQAGEPGRSVRSQLRIFGNRRIWTTMLVGAVGFASFFAVYSYIAPLVTEAAGAPEQAVPVVLAMMGVGMTAGTLLGGRLADAHLRSTVLFALVWVALSAFSMALSVNQLVPMAAIAASIGFGASMLGPAIQTRLMDIAPDNQTIAAALNHSAFNVGNSLGALLGGLVLAGGFGLVAPIWVAMIMALLGLGLAAVFITDDRKASRILVA